ncbi:hypothetical protein GCM10023237_07820 [Streptomyces coeruleoprunus]
MCGVCGAWGVFGLCGLEDGPGGAGGERLFEFDKPVWEHDLDNGLRLLRLGVETHAITSHFLLPLLVRQPGGLVVEMTDGTSVVQRSELP